MLLNIIPKLFVVAGVSVLLNGLKEMIDEIEGTAGINDRAVSYAPTVYAVYIRTLNKVWIFVEIIRNLIWFIQYSCMYIMMYEEAFTPGIIIAMVRISMAFSIILILIHVVLSIIIFINTWKVFGSYYLYRYNKGM